MSIRMLLLLAIMAGTVSCASPPRDANTEALKQLIERVNQDVNREIRYVAEPPRGNVWRRPTDGTGDCEDFALEKLWRIREQTGIEGFVMTYDEPGFGLHAVAIANGWVLDNLTRRMRPLTLPSRFALYRRNWECGYMELVTADDASLAAMGLPKHLFHMPPSVLPRPRATHGASSCAIPAHAVQYSRLYLLIISTSARE